MVASPPVADPDEALGLADRLHSAAIHLLRRLRRTDPMTGVSAAQLSALSVLMSGRRTIGELAAAEQVRPPTISRLIRQMEADGLVGRERDATDQRVVWIHSTDSGQRILARGRELRVSALAREIAALEAGDRRALAAGLAVIDTLLARL
jgi:DNA-binding MarR family transcriptional regulator